MREEWRVAFVMSQMKHAKTSDIAQHLGVSERSVERFRKKAMEIIEREMKDFAPLIITFASIAYLPHFLRKANFFTFFISLLIRFTVDA